MVLFIALVVLATAMAASGHAMPPGRIIPLHGSVGYAGVPGAGGQPWSLVMKPLMISAPADTVTHHTGPWYIAILAFVIVLLAAAWQVWQRRIRSRGPSGGSGRPPDGDGNDPADRQSTY